MMNLGLLKNGRSEKTFKSCQLRKEEYDFFNKSTEKPQFTPITLDKKTECAPFTITHNASGP